MSGIVLGSIHETWDTGSVVWKIPDFLRNVEKEEINLIVSPKFRVSGVNWSVTIDAYLFRTESSVLSIYICRSGEKNSVHWIAGIQKEDGVVVGSTTGISSIWTFLLLDIETSDVRKLVQSGVLTISLVSKCLGDVRSQSTQTSERSPDGEESPPPREPSALDKLSRDIQELLSSGASSDATILLHGEEFRVHVNILSARTPVFAAMFRHDTLEKASGVVKIEDCESDTMRQFLLYVYSGRVGDHTPKSASALYEIADKYQVMELKEECLQRLKSGLSVESFCHVIGLALRHGEVELTALATKFFEEHIKEIILTVEWQNFMGENPIAANELFIKALGAARK